MRSSILLVAALVALALAPARAGAQTPARPPTLPPPALPTPADIGISGLPAIAATNQLLTLTANVTVHPGGSRTGDIEWSFGDGATATGTMVTHAYRSAGSYDLRVATGGVSTFFSGVATISTDAQVTVQDSVTLQPGDTITFASPYVPYRPPPGSPQPPAIFGPLNVEVDDGSDQPLTVSYGYGSDPDGNPTSPAHIGLALPDGYALQVLTPHNIQIGPPLILGCTAIGARPNEADCTAGISSMPAPTGTNRVDVRANPAAEAHNLILQPGATAVLFGPESPEGTTGEIPVIQIGSASDQRTAISWDGAPLTITAPGSYAVAVDGARSQPLSAASVPIDCSVDADQSSSVQCALSAIPPVAVSYHTAVQAPSGTLTLRYADDEGPGTMIINNIGPDVAPGGAAIDVMLEQNGATYSGSGVMRPHGMDYLLAFELTDAAGNGYLYENEVTPDAGGFSGKGLWLNEQDETMAGSWSLGTPSAAAMPFSGGSITTAFPSPALCSPASAPPGCGAPPTGPSLPSFTGDQLIGFAPGSPALQPISPPAIGQAGQPVGLAAVTGAPCCGQGASQTFQWSFGDGTTSPPSSQQTVTHTWNAPGVYTVTAVFTDATDVRTFTLTQVRITPSG